MTVWTGPGVGNQQLRVGCGPGALTPLCIKKIILPLAVFFFAHVVNSYSLALAHARPTQTFPKNFKHPQLLICRSKNYEICTHGKLIARHTFSKSFKKSKNKMKSSDTAPNRFVHRTTFGPLGVNNV
jgi:hypothetical protein